MFWKMVAGSQHIIDALRPSWTGNKPSNNQQPCSNTHLSAFQYGKTAPKSTKLKAALKPFSLVAQR